MKTTNQVGYFNGAWKYSPDGWPQYPDCVIDERDAPYFADVYDSQLKAAIASAIDFEDQKRVAALAYSNLPAWNHGVGVDTWQPTEGLYTIPEHRVEFVYQWRSYSHEQWKNTNVYYWNSVGLSGNNCAEKRQLARLLPLETKEEKKNMTFLNDSHLQDLRTAFGMCHKQEHGLNVFKCATVCADLPNCPSKIVPKGWYDNRVNQIEKLQQMLLESEAKVAKLSTLKGETKEDQSNSAEYTIDTAREVLIKSAVQETGKVLSATYVACGLKQGIETTIVTDELKKAFRLSFKEVDYDTAIKPKATSEDQSKESQEEVIWAFIDMLETLTSSQKRAIPALMKHFTITRK